MRSFFKLISFTGLALTIAPAFFHFAGIIKFEQHLWVTFAGTAMYLLTAPFWMNKKLNKS